MKPASLSLSSTHYIGTGHHGALHCLHDVILSMHGRGDVIPGLRHEACTSVLNQHHPIPHSFHPDEEHR